jgi:hypothetical protein
MTAGDRPRSRNYSNAFIDDGIGIGTILSDDNL